MLEGGSVQANLCLPCLSLGLTASAPASKEGRRGGERDKNRLSWALPKQNELKSFFTEGHNESIQEPQWCRVLGQ